MRAYSIDLRKRVVEAVEGGESQVRVAATFSVSPATVKRWVARRRRDAEDDLAPGKSPGRPPKVLPQQRAALWSQLESNPAATLEEHVQLWWSKQGVQLSVFSMSRAIRRLGWTRKKGVWEPPSVTRRPGSDGGSA
jgi:transposase